MKNLRLTLFIPVLLACGSRTGDPSVVNDTLEPASKEASQYSAGQLTGYVETDDAGMDEFTGELDPVRANVRAINTIGHWSKTEDRELTETAEGGVATFYYSGGVLKKIVATQYGEMFRKLSEYYLLGGMVSFVFEKTLRYNRPLLYDSTAMRENGDDQVFDLDKSVMEEVRSYFVGGKLTQQIRDRNIITADSLPGEEARLVAAYKKMMALPVME